VRVLGLDIGSRSVDAVWLDEDGQVLGSRVADSGYDPGAVARELVERDGHDLLVATGYGRHVARELFQATVVTEITAYAVGAASAFPKAESVLDIGGQDTKSITLAPGGKVADFEMNDKCAAGTGKFLEVMARALGYDLDDMAMAALKAGESAAISSMCTVFAESEVTSLVHRGVDRAAIARGLHQSIARRTLSSLGRVNAKGPLVFGGGVAKNAAMVAMIRDAFEGDVLVPDAATIDPQVLGAYGAALVGLRTVWAV
jgi:predicted CoA-substrate-specific enzyme activase